LYEKCKGGKIIGGTPGTIIDGVLKMKERRAYHFITGIEKNEPWSDQVSFKPNNYRTKY
jgi:hypothetical protein